eukprot:11587429-Ditylum_brightwellii.AAC.1
MLDMTDMFGAIQSPTGAENMIVEMGRKVFKGEGDVRSWIEEFLPPSQPFGVFVYVYVVLELVLLNHTSVQAVIMEHNQKLQLEADEALVLKKFKNKLPTLFGRPLSEGGA